MKQSKKRAVYEAEVLEKCRAVAKQEARAEVRELAFIAGSVALGLIHGFAPILLRNGERVCDECNGGIFDDHQFGCSKRPPRFYVAVNAKSPCPDCKAKAGTIHSPECSAKIAATRRA